jgi:hypothetical protein
LDRSKFQLAKRIVLIAGQTLSSSAVLDGLRPDVHHPPCGLMNASEIEGADD